MKLYLTMFGFTFHCRFFTVRVWLKKKKKYNSNNKTKKKNQDNTDFSKIPDRYNNIGGYA